MAVDAFKAANDGQTFGEKYGTNTNDRNAYGKCVSAKASAKSAKQEAATLKASKTCKTERGTTPSRGRLSPPSTAARPQPRSASASRPKSKTTG